MRRRLYLMRHAEVSYFGEDGARSTQREVSLNEEGERRPRRSQRRSRGVDFDRVLTSGLPRTVETAAIVAPGARARGLARAARAPRRAAVRDPRGRARGEFVHAFRGVVPTRSGFWGGETIGELFDRVLPALERLVADHDWHTALAVLHGGVNRAILSYALTGERMFLGHFEQAPRCVNVLDVGDGGEWIVRRSTSRRTTSSTSRPLDDDGALLGAVPANDGSPPEPSETDARPQSGRESGASGSVRDGVRASGPDLAQTH